MYRLIKSLDRFELAAGFAAVILVVFIIATIIVGDRVGVGITTFAPLHRATTRSTIALTFTDPMNTKSVESRLVIDPPTTGKFAWSGLQLTFTPATALIGGQHYTVTLGAGASSLNGRRLIEPYQATFDVIPSRVVYLAPAVPGTEPANLWMVDPAAPFVITQLTQSRSGLLSDYAPSPDGTRIAFAEAGAGGTADLYVLTIESGAIQRITNCIQAICQAPSWSPDGTRLVYQRTELNPALPNSNSGVARAWIVNLTDLSTSLFLSSSQLLGEMPRWSPTGTQIAVYDKNLHSIAIYDLSNGGRVLINSMEEETGLFDPSGTYFAFPELAQGPNGFYTTYSIANLTDSSKGLQPITGQDQAPVNDRQAVWSPDGKTLTLAREALDSSAALGTQLYSFDLATSQVAPLLVDGNYNQAAMSWDSSGNQLVIQRLPNNDSSAQPGIWVYDKRTKSVRQIAQNGYLPQWLP